MSDTNGTTDRSKQAYLSNKLMEAALDLYGQLGVLDPRGLVDQFQRDAPGVYPGVRPPYWMQSKKKGEVLPVYRTSQELQIIRDRSRRLCAENEFAICAVGNRQNYAVGQGLVIRAVAASPKFPPDLLQKVQTVIDVFVKANRLPERQRDAMLRLDRDGEFFFRTFERPGGLLVVRNIEPEHVRSPKGDEDRATSFGVVTEPDDVETRKGYLVQERPDVNDGVNFVPAANVVHRTANVDMSAKRGVPTFYPVEQTLRDAEDLLRSMTSMAKARAKIALIRKFTDVTSSAASSLLDSLEDGRVTDPTLGKTLSLEQLRYGQILNASKNIDYDMPAADVDAAAFVQVLQAVLRAAAARIRMPEWMLTVDASNANLASSLVAEAPSVKEFETLQGVIKGAFAECDRPEDCSLVWMQLRYAVRLGVLPRETLRLVQVQAECPSLVVRDKGMEATTNKTYYDMRVKDRRTIQQELGLDPDEVDNNFKLDGIDPKKPPAPPPDPLAREDQKPPPPGTDSTVTKDVREAVRLAVAPLVEELLS